MPSRFKSSITKTGAFFEVDVKRTLRENARKMIEGVVAEGKDDVVGQLQAGEGQRFRVRRGGGRVSDRVVARVTSEHGKPWAVTGVVSVSPAGLSAPEAISLMAAASEVERQTHAFRRTAGRLRRARAANVDLLKGLR